MKLRRAEWDATTKLIPDGVQTMSKMPSRYVDGVYPTFIESGDGPYVVDPGGVKYVDYPLGLGTILLGHNNRIVKAYMQQQLNIGLLYPLPCRKERILAEEIMKIIPSMEMIRFVKTGSESCSAAVRIARAATGREHIVACGYHGWHDWYAASCDRNKGVPKCLQSLITKCDYNDIEGFKKAITDKTAAVILEPYQFDSPQNNFLEELEKLTHAKGAILIFDETITALRSKHGTAQMMFNVKADLTVFGKALGNGMPISCVGGKKELMQELEDKPNGCFVSSTFGGEMMSIAAALGVLKVYGEGNIPERIWGVGEQIKKFFNQTAQQMNLDAKCVGYPCRTRFDFPTPAHKSLFWQECLRKGVLFGHAQFISAAHDVTAINITQDAINHGMTVLRQYWGKPEDALDGEVTVETLRQKETNEGGTEKTDAGVVPVSPTVEKPRTKHAQR
jgi:glutamate-1-semialdehyde 2,1-aminomutase